MKEDGSLRLCLDPKDLNKTIKQNQWYARTLDNILPELGKHGATKNAHDGTVLVLCETARLNNLSLNSKKMQFNLQTANILGTG